jgi:8-oxo-dGTP pyrophosphatase MutT (NUDIX family)
MVNGVQGILIYDNQILIAKRSPLKKVAPQKWNLIGGRVEENESPINAMFREVKEEINLDLDNLIFVKEKKANWDGYKFNCFIFFSYIKNIDNLKLNDEHTEFKLVNLYDLKEMDIIGFEIEEILNYILEVSKL